MRSSPLRCYILAAGRSQRMGSPKALLPHQGEDLLCAIARRYHETTGAQSVGLVDEELSVTLFENWVRRCPEWNPRDAFGDLGLSLIIEVNPEQPMMDSVRIAFEDAVERGTDRLFLQPVDTGVPTRELIESLLEEMGEAWVAKPCYQGRGGHPLLLAKEALEAMDWKRAANLREALRVLPADRIQRVELDEPTVLRNWNRPEDLDRNAPT